MWKKKSSCVSSHDFYLHCKQSAIMRSVTCLSVSKGLFCGHFLLISSCFFSSRPLLFYSSISKWSSHQATSGVLERRESDSGRADERYHPWMLWYIHLHPRKFSPDELNQTVMYCFVFEGKQLLFLIDLTMFVSHRRSQKKSRGRHRNLPMCSGLAVKVKNTEGL